jgi:hypothetical protein
MLDRIGADRVLLEVDYPHSDSTWPDTQPLLRRRFEERREPDHAIAALIHGNAECLFRFG